MALVYDLICPYCGSELEAGVNKCDNCNAEFSSAVTPELIMRTAVEAFSNISGVGKTKAQALYAAGFRSVNDLKNASDADTAEVKGIGESLAQDIRNHLDKGEPKGLSLCTNCGAFMSANATTCPFCGVFYEAGEGGEEAIEEAIQLSPEEKQPAGELFLCPECGGFVGDGAERCTNCGLDLTGGSGGDALDEYNVLDDLEDASPEEILADFKEADFPVEAAEQLITEEKLKGDLDIGDILLEEMATEKGEELPMSKAPKRRPVDVMEESLSLSISDTESGLMGDEMGLDPLTLCKHCGAFISSMAQICPVCNNQVEPDGKLSIEAATASGLDIKDRHEELLGDILGVSGEITPAPGEDEISGQLMLCPHCGAFVSDIAVICPLCKNDVTEAVEDFAPVDLDYLEEELEPEELRLCKNCGAFVNENSLSCEVCSTDLTDEFTLRAESLPIFEEGTSQSTGTLRKLLKVKGDGEMEVDEDGESLGEIHMCPECGAFVGKDAVQCSICKSMISDGLDANDIIDSIPTPSYKISTVESIEDIVDTSELEGLELDMLEPDDERADQFLESLELSEPEPSGELEGLEISEPEVAVAEAEPEVETLVDEASHAGDIIDDALRMLEDEELEFDVEEPISEQEVVAAPSGPSLEEIQKNKLLASRLKEEVSSTQQLVVKAHDMGIDIGESKLSLNEALVAGRDEEYETAINILQGARHNIETAIKEIEAASAAKLKAPAALRPIPRPATVTEEPETVPEQEVTRTAHAARPRLTKPSLTKREEVLDEAVSVKAKPTISGMPRTFRTVIRRPPSQEWDRYRRTVISSSTIAYSIAVIQYGLIQGNLDRFSSSFYLGLFFLTGIFLSIGLALVMMGRKIRCAEVNEKKNLLLFGIGFLIALIVPIHWHFYAAPAGVGALGQPYFDIILGTIGVLIASFFALKLKTRMEHFLVWISGVGMIFVYTFQGLAKYERVVGANSYPTVYFAVFGAVFIGVAILLVLTEKYATAFTDREIRLGNQEYQRNNYSKAIDYYEKALTTVPDNIYNDTALVSKASVLLKLGEPEDALYTINRALKVNPLNEAAWNTKGNALARLGRDVDAINCYNRALKLNQRYDVAWNNKGNSMARLGKLDTAISCYNRALTIEPRYRDAWVNKGYVLVKLGRYDEAVGCADKVRAVGATAGTARASATGA
jgi:Tfp pilus assembly protein PilF/RNA polymerase subunit RPABC4/transcription elongation factor Spt4